jgi:hypothetical protein
MQIGFGYLPIANSPLKSLFDPIMIIPFVSFRGQRTILHPNIGHSNRMDGLFVFDGVQ